MELLIQIGTAAPHLAQSKEILSLRIGLGIHLFVGSLLGLLYAVCQQGAPVRGLGAVGIFYGFFIWIVSSVLIRFFLDSALHGFVHHWVWVSAHLVYGLCLAGVAGLKQSRYPLREVVPKD